MSIDRQWNLSGRGHCCAATGRPFTEGEEIYTALFFSESTEQFERRDYSRAAWESRSEGPEAFSSWKSAYVPPPPPDAKPEIVEHESPEHLFRRLLAEDAPATLHAGYILAIMLERKKVLEQTDVREENGSRLRIYRHRRTDEVFVVRDPNLKLDELGSIQAEVMDLLAHPAHSAADEDDPDETSTEGDSA